MTNHTEPQKPPPQTPQKKLGTRDPQARELSQAEFLRAARALRFSEKELDALRRRYGDAMDRQITKAKIAPSGSD